MITIDIPGVRALHDRHGSIATAAIARRMRDAPAGFTAYSHAAEGWEDVFADTAITAIGMTRRHVRIMVQLAEGVSAGDGLLLLRPASRAAGEMRASTTLEMAALGRPVTDLISHPLLDARMTIQGLRANDAMESWISLEGAVMGIDQAIRILVDGGRP